MKLYTMKRMLVCTDLSENSDMVVKAAEDLRSISGGTIDLLYVSQLGLHIEEVLSDKFKETYQSIFLGDLKVSVESKIKAQIDRCGPQAEILYRDGDVDEVILEIAQEGKHDLIVMGHGRKSIMKQVFGSNAYKVIASTPLPLFVVKSPLVLGKIAGLIDESRARDRLIIGTLDFLRNFKCREAKFVSLWLDFTAPFGNSEEGPEIETKIKQEVEHFSEAGDRVSVRVESTKELKVANHLKEILTEEDVDIAVVKRFTGLNLGRIHIGSTTKRLIEIFEGNILVIPPETNK